jgi:hypothetical protein
MNFYSLDGSKIDSNNLFGGKQIYERFDNTQNKLKSLDDAIDDSEEFVSVPTTKSNATDNNYQCSDGYNVKGTTLNKDYNNVSLVDCKNMCASSGTDCIGFNYDNSKKVCTLKKDASSLMNANSSSTLCIKKSAGNASCKIDNTIKAFNDLDSIFNNQTNNMPTGNMPTNNMPTGNMPTGNMPTNNMPTGNMPTDNMSNSMNTSNNYPMEIPSITVNKDIEEETETNSNNSTNENKPNMGNNPPGVYVDLDCFMKNINVLENHTDNMMIDLSLLLSNIKTCSYVKKTSSDSKVSPSKMNTTQLIDQITSKINIPEPDVVKLKNIKADILVTEPNSNSPSQLLEVSKEPFESNTQAKTSKSYNWSYQDLVMVVILIVLIYLLIFRE